MNTAVHTFSVREPISEETRERMRRAKLGTSVRTEYREKIAEGLRQWHAEPMARLRGFARGMSDSEHADYVTLRHRGRYGKAEALTMIGRADLMDYRPAPKPPVSIYRRLPPAEKRAYWLTWREARDWRHAMRLIGRRDLARGGVA